MREIFFYKGVATLPTIMALTILILVVGLSIAEISITESFISLGQKQSSQALSYAETGARDALIRIARDKNYTCTSTDCYTIDMVENGCATGDGCAAVTVSSGAGTVVDPRIITSRGEVKDNIRRIQVSVVLDAAGNGEIVSTAWQELTN